MSTMYEAVQLMRILSKNSPVRDEAGTVYTGVYKSGPRKGKRWKKTMPLEIKRHGKVVSPYPGNLRDNGTRYIGDENSGRVELGFNAAEYAIYANKKSRKPKYIEKSIAEFRSFLLADGWEEANDEWEESTE